MHENIKVSCLLPTRVDRYIRRLHPSMTQGIIEKALRNGSIRVNNLKISSDHRVSIGDEIFIFSSLIQSNNPISTEGYLYSKHVELLAKDILHKYLLYSSDRMIAINKPHSMAVQGGTKVNISIDEALGYINETNAYDNNNALKLVHRLDKETSGILLIAKGVDNSHLLMKAFQSQLIKKKYIAIVHGRPEVSEGSVVTDIIDSNNKRKAAKTNYKLLNNFASDCSLIEFTPETGRTHQIRLHSLELGCPIVGDKKYFLKEMDRIKANRMFLHSAEIYLPAEIFGEQIFIESLAENFYI